MQYLIQIFIPFALPSIVYIVVTLFMCVTCKSRETMKLAWLGCVLLLEVVLNNGEGVVMFNIA